MPQTDFDLVSPEFKRDPLPMFSRLRELGPVVPVKLPMLGATWVTTTYEATVRVLRAKEDFVVEPARAGRRAMAGVQWWMPRWIKAMTQNMLGRDEPDHRRLRSLMDDAFGRQSVEELRPRIAMLVDRQLDELEQAAVGRPSVDFAKHFSRPLPAAVIGELLGLPKSDRSLFVLWSNFGDATGVLGMLKAFGGLRKILVYLSQQIEQCRAQPRPGMLSALVEAEHEGERLSKEELLASAMLLLVAGHETTVHLINGGVLTFEDHPNQKAELLADWTNADAAIDELLRYFSPVQMTKPRYVARDIQLYGKTIRRGEFITPLLAAANADPTEFQEPERFDIHRRPNRHVAFGTGIHVCLGLKLAKAEVGIAFQRLFERFPQIAIAPQNEELRWTSRIGIRALKELPVRLAS